MCIILECNRYDYDTLRKSKHDVPTHRDQVGKTKHMLKTKHHGHVTIYILQNEDLLESTRTCGCFLSQAACLSFIRLLMLANPTRVT